MFEIDYYPELEKKGDQYLDDYTSQEYEGYDYETDIKRPIAGIYIWAIICLVFSFILTGNFFEGLLVGGIIMVLTSFIPMIIYSIVITVRQKNAVAHGVSKTDEEYIDNSIKSVISAAGAASTLHALSKGIKNLTK